MTECKFAYAPLRSELTVSEFNEGWGCRATWVDPMKITGDTIYVIAEDAGANTVLFGSLICLLGVLHLDKSEMYKACADSISETLWSYWNYIFVSAGEISIKMNQTQLKYGLFTYNGKSKSFEIM